MTEVQRPRGVDLQKYHLADLLGREPEGIDIADILLTNEEPFGITITADSNFERSRKDYLVGLNMGEGYYPWISESESFSRFGNNEGSSVQGLFSIDQANTRVLYFPTRSLATRDAYVGVYNMNYGWNGTIADILRDLEEKELPFFQATSLWNYPSLGEERKQIFEQSELLVRVHLEFERATKKKAFESFQIEGERSLDQILNKELLAVTPLENDIDSLLNRVAPQW